MGQFTIDTLNKTDRDNAMVALHAIAINNSEEPLFCPINCFNDQANKLKNLDFEYQKCQEFVDSLKEELENERNRNNSLLENNNKLNAELATSIESNSELKVEIKLLKDKLRAFIPGYGSEGEKIYYKPDGEKLETTTIHANALFVGASIGENVYEFQFNEEKGPHLKAIQTMKESLVPFCEIEYSAPEGNYIENGEKGSFSLINGEFKIIKKAKISIVKK